MLVSGTLTNSSFQNGLYTFETSAGAEVGNDYFEGMLSNGDTYEDLTGLITKYDSRAFGSAIGSTIKLGGGLTFGHAAFKQVQNSTIEVGNFDASATQSFGQASTNSTFRFKGTIGATTGDDNIFSNDVAVNANTIETIVSNQTSNGGNVEGDLDFLITNGATVSFVL